VSAVDRMPLDKIGPFSHRESASDAVGNRAAVDARHFRMAGRDQRSMDRYRESIITKRRKKCFMMAGERDRACSVEFAADSVCPAITGMGAVPQ